MPWPLSSMEKNLSIHLPISEDKAWDLHPWRDCFPIGTGCCPIPVSHLCQPQPVVPHGLTTERAETPDPGTRAPLILPGIGPRVLSRFPRGIPAAGWQHSLKTKPTQLQHCLSGCPGSLPACCSQARPFLAVPFRLAPAPCPFLRHQEPPSAQLPAQMAAPTMLRSLKLAAQQSSALPSSFFRAGRCRSLHRGLCWTTG